MTTTQFTMVEELASIIKDNLYSKHLILSTEEALINFIQDDTSVDGTLELQPVGPYHRLLLHRLAEIYGFVHESVGEGDGRHVVLERCPETAIPGVLVSDMLWLHDQNDASTSSYDILRREDVPVLKSMCSLSLSTSFEDREAAYQAARARIFALHEPEEKDATVPKARKVPVVARRMIAHALGQKIHSTPKETPSLLKCEENGTAEEINDCERNNSRLHNDLDDNKGANVIVSSKLSSSNKPPNRVASFERRNGYSAQRTLSRSIQTEENLQKEHIGGAKRIFAHALGLHSGKGSSPAAPAKLNAGDKLQ